MKATAAWLLLVAAKCSGPSDEAPDGDDDDDEAPDDTGPQTTVFTSTYVSNAFFGFVTMASGEVPAAAPDPTPTAISAGFTGENTVMECVRRVLSADCVELDCTLVEQGVFGGVSAGTLDIEGLVAPIQLVESDVYDGVYLGFYDPDSASYYLSGQNVTVASSGATVPSFSLTTPAPDQYLTLLEPAPPPERGFTPVVIPAGSDLRYVWEPTDVGQVEVNLYAFQPPPRFQSIKCSRLGTPLVNELVIPLSEVEAWRQVPAAGESIRYSSVATTVAGDYPVIFELSSPVVTSTGELFTQRTLQLEPTD